MAAPKNLLEALHVVQANAPVLPRDAEGQVGTRHYKYTTLATVNEKVRDLLRVNGLVWTSQVGGTHSEPTLLYRLMHVPTGEELGGVMPLFVPENPTSQQLGSAITYARRYAKVAVLDLVAEDDDDGAAASSGYGQARVRTGRPMASIAQGTLIQRLISEKKVTKPQLQIVLDTLGIQVSPDHEGWISELTGGKDGQASALISFLKENPIPTGGSDVPSDAGEFEQPELEGGDPVPFDEKP